MGLPAYQLNYDMATGFKNTRDRWYLLTPEIATSYFDSYVESALKNDYSTNISLEEIGRNLYTNYGKTWSDMEKTKETWIESLKSAYDSGAKMLMNGSNAYVLPYADRITSLPTASSNYGIVDEEIPFVQLALNGIIEYASENINLTSNPKKSFLKAIESDSCLSYAFIEQDPVVLRDTELSYLFGSSFESWSKEVADNYKRYLEIKEKTEYSIISNHEILQPGVVRVTYANNNAVIVNYNSEAVEIEGIVIDAMDFNVYERKD